MIGKHLSGALALLAAVATVETRAASYPARAFWHNGQGGVLVDVTKPPFNAKGDGIHDDTAALSADGSGEAGSVPLPNNWQSPDSIASSGD